MYKVKTTASFDKQFKKLDKITQLIIMRWIKKHLVDCENPRAFGKGLTANLSGYWRYRVGDYRIIAEIVDEELVIIAINVGHRREIYKGR